MKGYSPFEAGLGKSLDIPDIITFVCHPQYLNRPDLYPRQATILKAMFLQDELFTQYDYDVIGEWSEGFSMPEHPGSDGNMRYQGTWGCQPDLLERIKMNKAEGRKWFRENVLVIGRRGGKGYLGGLAGAYVLWHFLSPEDPQAEWAIDRDKRLAAIVFAGKLSQARDEQWKDLTQVILGAPCFSKFISRPQAQKLTVYSQHDMIRAAERESRGIKSDIDMASFEIFPKESTLMAGRGPASFMLYFDEMAHVDTSSGANASAEAVYSSATPSLDQFGEYGFIFEGSSPWQMSGQFYQNWQNSLEVHRDSHIPTYPEMFMVQLSSWDPYKDWEKAHKIRMRRKNPMPFKKKKKAMQEYDANMQKLEQANPETFAVERRCLDPETRVLCADLVWRPIKNLVVGDEIIALDEYAEQRRQRKMRTATVLNKWSNQDIAYRVTFTDGTHVTCSGNHRWLSAPMSSPSSFYWRSLIADPHTPGPRRSIKPGDTIRFLADPWEEDRSWEAGYLAGVYDGEGTAIGYPRREFRVSFVQNPGEVLDATLQYLKALGFDVTHIPGDRRAEVHVITGLSNVLRFVGQLGAHKLRRQAIPGMWEGRAMGRLDGRSSAKTIATIEQLPEQELIDIETSTGTFVAEGLISHNSRWAAAMNAYLNPNRIADMFGEYEGERLQQQQRGRFTTLYVAHGDPSNVGDNFGLAIAHTTEPDENGFKHVIFDRLHFWRPGDFVENDLQIDYIEIEKYFKEEVLDAFVPTLLTFDQFGGPMMIQHLRKYVAEKKWPRRIDIAEQTATKPLNWKMAEAFKAALNMHLLHGPWHEQAELELTFLQDMGNQRVDHPSSGPVQSKDVADAMMNVVYNLIGEQMSAFLGAEFSGFSITGAMQGGMRPFPAMDGENTGNDVFDAFGAFNRMQGERLSTQGMTGRSINRNPSGQTWSPSSPFRRGR